MRFKQKQCTQYVATSTGEFTAVCCAAFHCTNTHYTR